MNPDQQDRLLDSYREIIAAEDRVATIRAEGMPLSLASRLYAVQLDLHVAHVALGDLLGIAESRTVHPVPR